MLLLSWNIMLDFSTNSWTSLLQGVKQIPWTTWAFSMNLPLGHGVVPSRQNPADGVVLAHNIDESLIKEQIVNTNYSNSYKR